MSTVEAIPVSPLLSFIYFSGLLEQIAPVCVHLVEFLKIQNGHTGCKMSPEPTLNNKKLRTLKRVIGKQVIWPLEPNQILSHEEECVAGCTVTVTVAAAEALAHYDTHGGFELAAYARRDGHGNHQSAGNRRESSCASFNMSQSGHQKPWRAERRYLAPSLPVPASHTCCRCRRFLSLPVAPALSPPPPPLYLPTTHTRCQQGIIRG